MENIKDKLHIVTGHTYEEYMDKYGKKHKEGKLSIHSADKIEYLKQSKIYWEVEDPHGKIVYCQIRKLRPGYVLIPLAVIGVIVGSFTLGVLLGHTTISGFNGQVTEEQWKSALENITNIYENRKLSYSTESTFELKDGDTTQICKNLKVNGNLEEASYEQGSEKGTIYMYNYNHLPLISYREDKLDGRSTTTMLHEYLARPFGDFYTTMKDFTFNKNEKYYEYHETAKNKGNDYEFNYLDTTIKFDNSFKISQVTCKYELINQFTFNGDFKYKYDSPDIKSWGEVSEEYLKEMTKTFKKESDCFLTDIINVERRQSFITFASKDLNLEGINTIKLRVKDGKYGYNWSFNENLFANNTNLVRSEDYKYIFEKSNSSNLDPMVGIRLMTPLKNGDELTMKIALDYKVGSPFDEPQIELSHVDY